MWVRHVCKGVYFMFHMRFHSSCPVQTSRSILVCQWSPHWLPLTWCVLPLPSMHTSPASWSNMPLHTTPTYNCALASVLWIYLHLPSPAATLLPHLSRSSRRLASMRRILGSKTVSAKGKQRQQDPEAQSYDTYDTSASMTTPMEVLVEREVHSSTHDDQESTQPLSSSSTLVPPSPSGSARKQLPPGIRVPSNPYPYWHHHTPSSSSQSSLESPITPSHVSWLGGSTTNPAGPSTPPGTSTPSPTPASAPTPGRSSPNLFFPPPPITAPPANAGRSKPPTKSSHTLRAPVQEFCGQLSPIVEQDYMSPEKRPVSLPSSSHEGSGTRSSVTQPMMTPISPSAITPVSPLPMNPIFSLAGGAVPTPAGPSYGGLVKRKEEENTDSPRKWDSSAV
ncbi:hypothetical protein J3A83DRAFT_2905358 [Scleroderma citrinum]